MNKEELKKILDDNEIKYDADANKEVLEALVLKLQKKQAKETKAKAEEAEEEKEEESVEELDEAIDEALEEDSEPVEPVVIGYLKGGSNGKEAITSTEDVNINGKECVRISFLNGTTQILSEEVFEKEFID